jgi:hypothetical protein
MSCKNILIYFRVLNVWHAYCSKRCVLPICPWTFWIDSFNELANEEGEVY